MTAGTGTTAPRGAFFARCHRTKRIDSEGLALVVYILTLLVTFHGVPTRFDLDTRLTQWADQPRCEAIGELLREDLEDADHLFTYRCDRRQGA